MKKFLLNLSAICALLLLYSGVYSQAFSFNSANALTPVPDAAYNGTEASMASIPITVAGLTPGANFGNVSVSVNMGHTWIGDLVIKLKRPDGTTITLLSRPGLAETVDDGNDCCGTNGDLIVGSPITYTDSGAIPSENLPAGVIAAQSVQPSQNYPGGTLTINNLNAFFNAQANPNGVYTLLLGDSAGGDAGTVAANGVNLSVEQLVPGCTLVCSDNLTISLATSCQAYTIPANLASVIGSDCPTAVIRTVTNFTGPFAPNNAFVQNPNCITATPTTLTISSSDVFSGGPDCQFQFTVLEWGAPTDGFVNFNWSTINFDVPGFDFFGYAVNGATTVLSGTTSPGGAVSVPVNAGDNFAFFAFSTDGLFGSIVGTVTNFSFDQLLSTQLVQISGPAPGTQVGAGNYQVKYELQRTFRSGIRQMRSEHPGYSYPAEPCM
jgi:hypothetical protein